MASADYVNCRFSATLRTMDPAVLSMLRGLSQQCESGKYPQIAWGGTKAAAWVKADHCATFRFTRESDRASFLSEASRLLPSGSWHLQRTSGTDPATPQR